MTDYFKGKDVLITGGTGLIGLSLLKLLLLTSVRSVLVVSLDDYHADDNRVKFIKKDLRFLENCITLCEDKDIVFHLAGIKGSPSMTALQPASFYVPTLMFSINMMEAARRANVKQYLFTSSVGVYSPAEIFYEDDVWKTFPSENDKFAGWAKRICELQSDCYSIEHNWKEISIVRPANVYGPEDNFDPKSSMVIPSLIKKVFETDKVIEVWGDGSTIRDFIFCDDVARGMIFAIENSINKPINLGSGKGYSVKELVEIIIKYSGKDVKVFWDTSKPQGDKKRILSMERSNSYGFYPEIDLEEGIKLTVNWYNENHFKLKKKYNSFNEKL